jgi:enoyl-CoA hydratase/carnithine racemase
MSATKAVTRGKRSGSSSPARDLEVAREGGILVLTLARPDRRNSLSEAMLAALQKAIDEAAADDGVRAVVLTAEGSVFSAGHDLK